MNYKQARELIEEALEQLDEVESVSDRERVANPSKHAMEKYHLNRLLRVAGRFNATKLRHSGSREEAAHRLTHMIGAKGGNARVSSADDGHKVGTPHRVLPNRVDTIRGHEHMTTQNIGGDDRAQHAKAANSLRRRIRGKSRIEREHPLEEALEQLEENKNVAVAAYKKLKRTNSTGQTPPATNQERAARELSAGMAILRNRLGNETRPRLSTLALRAEEALSTLLEFDPNRGAEGRKDPKALDFKDAHTKGLPGAERNAHKKFASLSPAGKHRLTSYSAGRAFARNQGDYDPADHRTGGEAARSPDVRKDRRTQDEARFRREQRRAALEEGAVKAAGEDFIYALHPDVVAAIKSRGSAEKQSGKSIASTLAKHKVKPFMGHHRHSVDVIKMMFDGIHGDLKEAANPAVQSVVEAILSGDAARRSMLIRKRREAMETERRLGVEKREGRSLGTFAKMVVTPTENIPAHIDPTKRLKKRTTDKRGIVPVKKPDFDTPEEAAKHNQKVAHDIISAIHAKPHGTPVNLYGRKRGEGTDAKERKVRVSKKRIMGQDVHVIHGTDRQVHLNPSGAGLQVIDAKSKRMILDRGNDADW
jgi:hypothetical protein